MGKDDFTKSQWSAGLGDRFGVLDACGGKWSIPERFVALTSTNPAKIFGLYPQKGCLQPGSDADIAIWDPNLSVKYGVKVAQHRTDYNLFEGWNLKGMPVIVMQRGKILVENGQWYGKPGQGKFLHRLSGSPLRPLRNYDLLESWAYCFLVVDILITHSYRPNTAALGHSHGYRHCCLGCLIVLRLYLLLRLLLTGFHYSIFEEGLGFV